MHILPPPDKVHLGVNFKGREGEQIMRRSGKEEGRRRKNSTHGAA
jgi:hypothetical protein